MYNNKKLIIQSWENLVTDRRMDGQTDRRTRVISQNAIRLTSSVQHNSFIRNFQMLKNLTLVCILYIFREYLSHNLHIHLQLHFDRSIAYEEF